MVLVQDLLTESGFNLRFYDNFIEADDGPFKGSKTPMVDLGTYELKINTGEITPEESFITAYVEEVYESEQFHTSTKTIRLILDVK